MRFLDELRPKARETAVWLGSLVRWGWSRVRLEIAKTVDLDQFHRARVLAERAQAVSWPRAGLATGVVVATISLGIWAIVHPRPLGVAGPLPTDREIEPRIAAMNSAKAQPPASLMRGAPKLAVNPATVPATRESNQ
ncbi:hypothetical protein [Brevundimonas sp.]|uniref:hypothetical protein n=1 Tax=Brevundimonas sp. TaxID=1871086 RepID=UPI001A1A682E|nr:hypothetical protein [Brevundimonas sp.]MBJ7484083.1 hypothetical protein [Brevundimonas sp.]